MKSVMPNKQHYEFTIFDTRRNLAVSVPQETVQTTVSSAMFQELIDNAALGKTHFVRYGSYFWIVRPVSQN
jgi:hypothetical protein